MNIIILVFVLVVIVGILLGLSLMVKRQKGIWGSHQGGASPSMKVAEDLYSYTKDIMEEHGQDHIVRRLTTRYNIGAIDESYAKTLPYVAHKTAYEVFIRVAEITGATTMDEFIYRTELSYLDFVPAKISNELRDKLVPTDENVNEMVAAAITTRIPAGYVVTDADLQMDSILRWVEPLVRTFVRYNSLKKREIVVDHIRMIAVVHPLAKMITSVIEKARASERSVSDTLSAVDLSIMRSKDPVAVDRFIERMRRDIRAIDMMNPQPVLTYTQATPWSTKPIWEQPGPTQHQLDEMRRQRDLAQARADAQTRADAQRSSRSPPSPTPSPPTPTPPTPSPPPRPAPRQTTPLEQNPLLRKKADIDALQEIPARQDMLRKKPVSAPF